MFLRVLSFLLLIVFFTSCDKFSFSKKDKFKELDTVVDFTSVDTFPSFKECDSIIDKTKKADCFRTTIHKKIGEELLQHSLSIKDSIDEIIEVDLIINSKGKVVFQNLKTSEKVSKQLPKLDSIIQLSVNKLPSIYPAIKRGIPVTSKYQLPIRIVLKE